ncbi:MAG TPA: fluoride efflux transporter CrcB [Chitinophagaceae bacterium]|nr:fluoride efflux transporter CrcB [Chitinophagaceae bacterium]
MALSVLWVGLGGFLGTVCRYGTGLWLARLVTTPQMPWATWLVNILGSMAMGAIVALAGKGFISDHNWRLFLTVGFCGGFTTFSAFAYENLYMLQESQYLQAFLYTLGSLISCLLAVALGFWIGNKC